MSKIEFFDEYKRLNPKVLEIPHGEQSKVLEDQYYKYLGLMFKYADHNKAIKEQIENGKSQILRSATLL